MRFLITTDNTWQVTITCPAKGSSWQHTRHMRKISYDDVIKYPAPPIKGLDAHGCLLCAADQEEFDTCDCSFCVADNVAIIHEAYKRICDRRPATDEVKRFGHYLFEALIGEGHWRIIKEAAEHENAPIIELALSWPSSEKNLPRFNWEMMHNAHNFLAAGSGRTTVAITRIITNPDCKVRQMPVPPRILFVIGTKITDPVIKPGAEYLGLLRQLKAEGVSSIYSRMLENASPRRITQVINSFKPDVIHFICHGGIFRGRGYLELQTDEEETNPRCYGDQLAEFLRMEDGTYPPVIVLSACDSASTPTQPIQGRLLGAHETASLAAELIQSGVPIVLGMAGKVSDLACRLFTRQFGMALVKGKSLVTATAEARRATFALGVSSHDSIDWAFPAVFMAKDIDSAYVPVKKEETDPLAQIEQWIGAYKVENNPVFCGRSEFFQAYYDFFHPDGPQVLAIDVTQRSEGRLGKTRLLQELTIQALRDGHVPCLVSAFGDWTPPGNAIDLGMSILRAIYMVRGIFSLERPLNSQMLLLRNSASIDTLIGCDDLDPNIKPELAVERKITDHAIHLALQSDLLQLVKDVRKHVPLHASGHVLVLLDAVDMYGNAIDPLFQEMLGSFGLGTAYERIPVILAFSSCGPTQGKLKEHLENVQNSTWLRHLLLNPFDKNGEDMLAYEMILLHPFRPDVIPSVINEAKEDALVFCQEIVRNFLKGIPENFASRDFDTYADLGRKMKCLMEAKDKDIMEQFEKMRE